MHDPTDPDGRRAAVGLDGRRRRPIEPMPSAPRSTPRPRTRTGAWSLVTILVLVVATLGCSILTEDADRDRDLGGIDLGDPVSSSTTSTTAPISEVTLPEGFVLPDTRTVALPPVVGRPQPLPDPNVASLAVRGGGARLSGTVIGPDGPVGGATVRLERFVGDAFGREDIATNGEGRWAIDGLIGGRYRVRAWARPDLTTVEAQTAFVANENGQATLDIPMERHEGEQIQGALDVAEPEVGQIVTFRALVSRIEVDDQGIVRGLGIEGREVLLGVLGGMRLVGEKKPLTDADGFATFSVVCLETGVHRVVLRSGDLSADVELPDCRDGVLDLDALPPDVPEFAIGATFTVPTAGPFPPGTYTATTPGTCGTSFQEFIGDRWASNVSLDRTISPSNPIRNVNSVPGTRACTFRRIA